MRIMKWVLYAVGILFALALIYGALNYEQLKRLTAVNSLFSEEKIVSNFSNMDDLFLNKSVPVSGEHQDWTETAIDLPEKFKSREKEWAVEEWLETSAATSLLVVQDGKIAHEQYRLGTGADDLRISWSVAKSFLSAAFGVAVGEGKIDIESPVDQYVPAFTGTAYEGVAVRNVLNMASGVKFNEDYLDFWSDINKMGRLLALGGSMDEFAGDLKERNREQGAARQYVSIDTHVLAMVLRAATGKSLTDYLGEKIISPLGFKVQPYYLTDSEGVAFALGGLNMTTRDYARLGQLYLQRGYWKGRSIVPQTWVDASVVASAPADANGDVFGYGYQWWVPPGSTENGGDYLARGIYGQYIYINPQTKTVIVKTSANREFRAELPDGNTPSIANVDMFRAIAVGVSQ